MEHAMMLKVQPIESSISNAHREQGRSWGRKVAVEVRSLHKSYDQHLAVKDVSFSFRSGEVLGLLGPNGAGQSTVMMMITGRLAAESGEVIPNGEKYDGRRLEQMKGSQNGTKANVRMKARPSPAFYS